MRNWSDFQCAAHHSWAFISDAEERRKFKCRFSKIHSYAVSLSLCLSSALFIKWIECKHDEKKVNIEKHSIASFNCQFNAFIELSSSFILRTEYEEFFSIYPPLLLLRKPSVCILQINCLVLYLAARKEVNSIYRNVVRSIHCALYLRHKVEMEGLLFFVDSRSASFFLLVLCWRPNNDGCTQVRDNNTLLFVFTRVGCAEAPNSVGNDIVLPRKTHWLKWNRFDILHCFFFLLLSSDFFMLKWRETGGVWFWRRL